MTSLLASRRRAEEFARHLDEQRTSHDPNLAPLLELAARLRPAPIEPAPEFCAQLREHLLQVAEELPPPERVEPAPDRTGTRLLPTRIRVTGMATAFVAASILVAVAVLARGALPGDALYPVKQRLEGAQVAVATNPESRGHQYLAQSEHRLSEMAGLLDGQALDGSDERVPLIESTLHEFTTDFRAGARMLTEVYRTEGRSAPLNRLREFAASASGRLAGMGPLLPPELGPAYDEAMNELAEVDREAKTICPACGPAKELDDLGRDEGERRSDPGEREPEPEPSATTETRTPGQTVPPDDPTTPPETDEDEGEGEPEVPVIKIPGIRLPGGLKDLGLPLPDLLGPDFPLNLPTAIALPVADPEDTEGDESTDGLGTDGEDTDEESSSPEDPKDEKSSEPDDPESPTDAPTTPGDEDEEEEQPRRITLRDILEELRLPFLR